MQLTEDERAALERYRAARGEWLCRTCRQCPCCCGVRRHHLPDCRFRRAVECSTAIACEHGRDVCPVCDKCTCKEPLQ